MTPLFVRARCPLGAEGAASLARCSFPGLRTLLLGRCGIPDEGAAALAGARWQQLRVLDFSCNEIGPRGAAALAAASWPGLEALDLAFCEIGPEGAALLAGDVEVAVGGHSGCPSAWEVDCLGWAFWSPTHILCLCRWAWESDQG